MVCVFERESFEGEFSVFSAVVGVSDNLMSASVRVHRKTASLLPFVKDIVSLLRRLGVSLNRHGSEAVPGPSMQGHVRFARSRRMLL